MAPQDSPSPVQPTPTPGQPAPTPLAIGQSLTTILPTLADGQTVISTVLLSSGVIISVPQPNSFVVVQVITSVNSNDPNSPGLLVQTSFLQSQSSTVPSSATPSSTATSASSSAASAGNSVVTPSSPTTPSSRVTPSSSIIPSSSNTSNSGVSTQTTLSTQIPPSPSIPTASATGSANRGRSSDTGLIAGIAVLGVLLAIALGILAFLLLRKRRGFSYFQRR